LPDVGVELAELLEDLGMVFGGDAGTVIGDLDAQGFVLACTETRTSPPGGVNLTALVTRFCTTRAMASRSTAARTVGGLAQHVLLVGERANGVDGIGNHLAHVALGDAQEHLPRFDLAGIEQNIHHLHHPARGLHGQVEILHGLGRDEARLLLANQIEVVEHGGEWRAQVVHDHVHHAVAHVLQFALLGQQVFQLALLPAQLQVDGDPGFDLFDVKGLGDVVEPAAEKARILSAGSP
jgi:hypothetical protein